MSRRSVFSPLISSLTAILILAAGCSDQAPTALELETSYQAVALPKAETSPAFARLGTAGKVIGPEGGEIRQGRISIRFPAGALSEPTEITVNPNARNLAVTFGPHGLQFPAGHEPTATFSYEGIAGLPERDLTVFYVSDSGAVLEKLTASVDAREKSVSAKLRHFSEYALVAP